MHLFGLTASAEVPVLFVAARRRMMVDAAPSCYVTFDTCPSRCMCYWNSWFIWL